MAEALLRIHGATPVAFDAHRSVSISHRPFSSANRVRMVAVPQTNQSYWTSINADIATHLHRAIPLRPPLVVFESMRHLVFAAPPNMAPALCIAACELVGGSREDAMAAAAALHLMHAAAFTHKHLPLTDRPAAPRPTIRHAYGPNVELLTGDGIVPLGYEMVAKSMDRTGVNSGRILRVIAEISRATGSQGTIEGHFREYSKSTEDESGDDTWWVDDVCNKKEGELYSCGGACGAIIGGGSEDEIEKLRRYGHCVGMIEGASRGVGGGEKKYKMEVIKELRGLALKELKGFDKNKIEVMSSFLDCQFCNV